MHYTEACFWQQQEKRLKKLSRATYSTNPQSPNIPRRPFPYLPHRLSPKVVIASQSLRSTPYENGPLSFPSWATSCPSYLYFVLQRHRCSASQGSRTLSCLTGGPHLCNSSSELSSNLPCPIHLSTAHHKLTEHQPERTCQLDFGGGFWLSYTFCQQARTGPHTSLKPILLTTLCTHLLEHSSP